MADRQETSSGASDGLPGKALSDWLLALEHRHPRAIDLGLERVSAVWRAMASPRPAPCVITVGGTNGKGSTVAFIEAAACAQGWRVGCYTSPHLLRYNERVRVDGVDADDAALVAAFEAVEAARGDVSLTYFEFGTLAAFHLLAEAGLDLAVLEVGLGGRLDAVNLIDADVAVVTTVALDHTDWLGDTRAAIAVEKAGIARAGRPLLVGERDAEPALLASAGAVAARLFRLGQDFDWCQAGPRRVFRVVRAGRAIEIQLPTTLPLVADRQWDNAATALAALAVLPVPTGLPGVDLALAARGLAATVLPGRLQTVCADPEIVVDIGHNPQAAQTLANWLRHSPKPTLAVFSALADKDVAGLAAPLVDLVDAWHLAGLDGDSPRGMSGHDLAARLGQALVAERVRVHGTVADALRGARAEQVHGGRILVFGSFLTVAAALQAIASPA